MATWFSLLLLHALATVASAAHHWLVAPSVTPRGDGHHSRGGAGAAFVPSPLTRHNCNHRWGVDWLGIGIDDGAVDAQTGAEDAAVDGEDEGYVDRGLRFSGVGRLYANKDIAATKDAVLDRLQSATVAVIGVGGVGSWAAEALCRSGIGNLILVDLDDICISNTNRQLHATASAVGKMKIDEMGARLRDINPSCNVTLIHDFVTVENANAMVHSLMPEVTACIDAIDGVREKTALILACVQNGIPIVTCGGAAGRTDPTQIRVDDLTKVQEDRLLFRCRKLLRRDHGFPKVPMPGKGKKERVRRWRIPAVYSTEVQQRAVDGASGSEDAATSSFRTCDGALGTACFVTGTYGMVAGGQVVEMIANEKLVIPKKLSRRVDG